MAVILPVNGILPHIPESCFIAPNATLVGDVILGEGCSVWFSAVVRGDVNKIRIGARVNIQDGACIHCTYQRTETHIGSGSIIAAGAVVLEGTVVPSGTVWAGVPAKQVKAVSPELLAGEVDRIAAAYSKYASWFMPADKED